MSAAELKAMHQGPAVLVLPNVWDAVSARSFVAAGFPAVATASTAVSASLGHPDGEQTPREEMFAAVARIAAAVDVPVSADVEAGYGLPPPELVARLLDAGVVGCNLEDTNPRSGELRPAEEHAAWLHEVCQEAGGRLVVNARVDVYLREGSTEEAIRRGRLYREAGADCVYPIFAPDPELPALVEGIGGPLNVHAAPDDAARIAQLQRIGIRRVTFGGSIHRRLTGMLEELAQRLRADTAVG